MYMGGDSGQKKRKIEETTPISKKKIIRCSFCKKKCNMINYSCKCGGVFCQTHRLIHSHDCPHIEEKKMEMKEKIKNNNKLIMADKLLKI
jgi:predicted nucleic acid binding AN1-type Zn finger protein